MADVHIPDDIIINILGRLPAKPLLRSRCVSRHWYQLISDPYFMNSRSRKKVLFHAPPLYVLDDYAPVDHNSMAKLPYPFENQEGRSVLMIGTFNGIVLLVVTDYIIAGPTKPTGHMILYNPFTRASKIVHDPYSPFNNINHVYGFAYADDDLKVVRFRDPTNYCNWNNCDVFNLKTSSWNSLEIHIENARFQDSVGTFLDGFLYWRTCVKIVALNVREMVISEIHLPRRGGYRHSCLGTLHGHLCWMINNHIDNTCDVWSIKEDNLWSKAISFTLGPEVSDIPDHYLINIMDDGRILMTNVLSQVVIYDRSKHSSLNYKSSIHIDLMGLSALAIDYTETLISPLAF